MSETFDIGIRVWRPDRALQPYLRYIYRLTCGSVSSLLTFPTGSPQIIFHRKTPLFIPELTVSQSRCTISGQTDFPAHVSSSGDTDMIVAVFHPHTIGLFIDDSPASFHNLEIAGDDTGDRSLADLASRISENSDFQSCVTMISHWLLRRLNRASRTAFDRIDRTGEALKKLMSDPGIKVAELADTACLGTKQFRNVFNNTVGMKPKEYTRIVRFQKSMWLLQCGLTDFIGIAHECGYADQSHFIREFKAHSGHTPSAIAKICTPYSDMFGDPEKYPFSSMATG